MAEHIQSVRGMNDLLPPDAAHFHAFEYHCRAYFERTGYQEIRTPICESTALFSRGIGEATDIVEKEMYTFPDRKGRMLTLRPEMTASCARAYIQHALHKKEPMSRWFYSGPMFRYERMQTGRYRQFYQIGCEAYGVESSTVDAEQIAMVYELYQSLGVAKLDLRINSVGNQLDRPAYRAALVLALSSYLGELCADCQRRMDENPLRILDCKKPRCREIASEAPSILDHLGDASRQKFDDLRSALDAVDVPYTVDSAIVRGLDYYTGAVFEIIGHSPKLGTHSTLVAGGRYDNLVESLGGPATPAVGFALGVERALLSLAKHSDSNSVDVYIATGDDTSLLPALKISTRLKRAGYSVDFDHRVASFKSQFKRANQMNARLVVSVGSQEAADQSCRVKDMGSRSEEVVSAESVVKYVESKLA